MGWDWIGLDWVVGESRGGGVGHGFRVTVFDLDWVLVNGNKMEMGLGWDTRFGNRLLHIKSTWST